MKDSIKLEYVEKGVVYQGSISRKEILDHMEYLKDSPAFAGNNEIATRLIALIPEMAFIKINKDANDTQDVPYIWYETTKREGMLKISRRHSIIWGFLNHFCYEAKLNH